MKTKSKSNRNQAEVKPKSKPNPKKKPAKPKPAKAKPACQALDDGASEGKRGRTAATLIGQHCQTPTGPYRGPCRGPAGTRKSAIKP